jgi:sensor c-di-GMP phosphodiesterase-like protein
VDFLKVDKSFIDEVSLGDEQSALTASIIKVADTLELMPVAEGIEREDQVDRLLELQCALGQGLLLRRAAGPRSDPRLGGLVEAASLKMPSL